MPAITDETDVRAALRDSEIGAEILRRQRARISLLEYAQAIDIPGAPAKADDTEEIYKPIETRIASVNRLTMQAVERTMLKKKGRLMLFLPPGCAKSTYADVVGGTWALGKWPGHRIILASYASNIAEKQSKKARNVCRQKGFSNLWPERPRLLDDQRAADQWSLTNGSEFMAAGLLAGITGNRANGVIIDDPVANREQADSATLREKTYAEYIDTALTRLLPGGYCILIMTRWHQEDLAGSILPEDWYGESGTIHCRDGQDWDVLCLPAKCEREDDPLERKIGEYIWPEWFPTDHWATWENNPRARRTWAALYQQRPSLDSGLHFSREMFKWYDPDLPPDYKVLEGDAPAVPGALRKYIASDYATLDNEGDFTEHGVAGMDERGDLWFIDWWSGQKTTDVTIERFIDMLRKHKPMRGWNEGSLIDKAIGPAIRRRMRETQCFTVLETLPSLTDKAARLQSFHARASAGTVWLPLKRQWAEDLLNQLIRFPAGKYDDKADVCGLLGRGVDQMMDARPLIDKPKPLLIPFTGDWLESEADRKPKTRYF